MMAWTDADWERWERETTPEERDRFWHPWRYPPEDDMTTTHRGTPHQQRAQDPLTDSFSAGHGATHRIDQRYDPRKYPGRGRNVRELPAGMRAGVVDTANAAFGVGTDYGGMCVGQPGGSRARCIAICRSFGTSRRQCEDHCRPKVTTRPGRRKPGVKTIAFRRTKPIAVAVPADVLQAAFV